MSKQELGLFYKYAKSIERYDKKFLEDLYQAIDKTEGWLWPNQAYILYAVASHLKGKLVEIEAGKVNLLLFFVLLQNYLMFKYTALIFGKTAKPIKI